MLIIGDKVGRIGWALVQRKTGEIRLSEICDTRDKALALKHKADIHTAHRGPFDVRSIAICAEVSDRVDAVASLAFQDVNGPN